MKTTLPTLRVIVCLLLFSLTQNQSVFAQCNNSDFESGDFTGWTGTNGQGTCMGTLVFGVCVGCFIPDPLQNAGILRGPDNAPPNYGTQFSHFIMTGGYDPILGGTIMPVVYPGSGTRSARLGNMWPDATGNPNAETMSYAFTVTPNNCNFTYHYAVVLNAGSGHSNGEQPFFQIRMTDGSGNPITCASYDVDANSAPNIGGFVDNGSQYYKTWSSVFIPLNNYIGQNVKITFTTRSCAPLPTCHGSHYAYAYIDAECGPLQIVSSSPTICGGQNITLSAPIGAGSYSWSGPGIVGSSTGSQVTVNLAGHYHVDMTTLFTPPQTACQFSLDTIIPGSPGNPVAKFSATSACAGNPLTFTDASTPVGSVSTWAWDFNNDGTPDDMTQNPTHTFPTAGNYPVRLVVSWPPCLDDTTITVVVSPAPTSSFTAVSPACSGLNATVTYTGNAGAGDTYTWNFGGGTIISGSNQGPYQISWPTAGTKTITLTVTSNGCTSSLSTVPVTLSAAPVVSVTPDLAICNGGSATLTASGGTTYSWAPGTGLSGTSGASVTANPVSTTTYAVTGTTGGCSDSASVTVTVGGLPTSTFTVASPVCAGANSTITYTGNAAAGATYTWNFDGGTAVPGSGQGPHQVNWTTAGTKNITLTVAVGTCTSPQTSMPVTVNPGPTSTFTTMSPVCTGVNSTIGYTGTGTGTATYTWGFDGGTIASGTGQGPYQINWATIGTKNLTLTVSDLGCSSSSTGTVVVNDVPTSTFTTISPVCEGANSTITYTGTATAGATYNWSFDGGTVVSGTGQGPCQVNWNTGGTAATKNITLIVDENNCSSTFTMPVVINPSPTSAFTTVSPVCIGITSTITYTGTGTAAGTYIWGFDGGTIVSGTGAGPYQIQWTTMGSKNITLSVDENGCSSNGTGIVLVNDPPTSVFTVTSPVCVGQNSDITYTGTATAGAIYTWDFDGGIVGSGAGQGPYQVNWASGGTGAIKNITLTVNENNCISSGTTMTVTVNDVPVSDAGLDTAFCSGGNAPIGTTPTAGYTYAWSPALGLSDPAVSNPVAAPTNTTNAVVTTTYTVTTTNANCSSTDAVDITVTPLPVASFLPQAGQCLAGNSFNFQAGGSFISSAAFAWDFGPDATPLTSASKNQNVIFSVPGTSTISLTISQAGCVSNVYSDVVTVYPMPEVIFTADTLFGCENLPVCFTDNSISNAPTNYQWTFGDGNSSALPGPCHTYAAPGVYTVALQITSADGCQDDSTVVDMITVMANPTAAFTMSTTVIQLPETTIDLQNTSQNALTYLWMFGDSGTSTLTTPGTTAFTKPGSYPITLYAYNQLGCFDSVEHPVTVYQQELIFVPNVFTPNGDGNNDYFEVYGLKDGWKQFEVKIFDRWGEKVYESTDMNFKWDGTYKGHDKHLGPAVFVYALYVVYTNNHADKLYKGTVTLVR